MSTGHYGVKVPSGPRQGFTLSPTAVQKSLWYARKQARQMGFVRPEFCSQCQIDLLENPGASLRGSFVSADFVVMVCDCGQALHRPVVELALNAAHQKALLDGSTVRMQRALAVFMQQGGVIPTIRKKQSPAKKKTVRRAKRVGKPR